MISIIVPALNEGRLLSDCLESLINQDYEGEYEIIVVDNGSTDNTADIAKNFGAKVIPCSERKCVSYARQVGADVACGDIIAQADADTVYPRDWLTRIADHFYSHPDTVAVAGRFIYRDPPSWAKFEYFLRDCANRLAAALFGRPFLVSGATFAFRRRAFLNAGGYKNISYSPDQYGISSQLSKVGRVSYDRNLYVLTSSRSVRKPLFLCMLEALVHIGRWSSYVCKCYVSSLERFANKTTLRRVAVRLSPVAMVIILIAYGYVIPTSPVFGKVYYRAIEHDKVVALTFDDGPNEPYTSEILDILDSYNIKGTFFVVGKNVELYPETAKRMVAEGHVLGNHSYSHNANHALTAYGGKDLAIAEDVIFHAVGVRPHLYRPPHGKKSPWELEEVKKQDLIEVTWSVSTAELSGATPSSLVQNIVRETHPGEIILLHDGYGTLHDCSKADKSLTVEALPLIIEKLQAEGYRFVTVPELLDVPAYNG
jgi:peptidoglycan/xylan/chitin deacetylase (PgdA/CDA1 family)/glycosyltransferase involved in cell wall biosynthesis